MISVHVTGVLSALGILIAIGATFYWMLHPPRSTAEEAAVRTERDVAEILGRVLVIFSQEIHSEHVMSLAARVARRERAQLLAAYVIEVPHTLPITAAMEVEHREALGVLQVAESIARQNNVELETEVVRARQVGAGALELARHAGVHLIILGSYREGKYAGAPLGRAIEVIAAQAQCDVLIGIQGHHGKILTPPAIARTQKAGAGFGSSAG